MGARRLPHALGAMPWDAASHSERLRAFAPQGMLAVKASFPRGGGALRRLWQGCGTLALDAPPYDTLTVHAGMAYGRGAEHGTPT